ncbi:MAG: hypothetical protein R3B96_16470 [Pirellulaceae bacterium]
MKGNLWASASANIGGTLLGLRRWPRLLGYYSVRSHRIVWPGMPNEIFVIVMALAVMFTTLINRLVRFSECELSGESRSGHEP